MSRVDDRILRRCAGRGTGLFGKFANEPRKYESMDGPEEIPVEETEQPLWREERRLNQPSPRRPQRLGLKLEPRPARHFHLRPQAHQAARIDRFHAPEIDGIPDSQIHRVAPPTAESHAADEPVSYAAQAPQSVPRQPAFAATQGRKLRKDGRG